jgi:hypothetical protein
VTNRTAAEKLKNVIQDQLNRARDDLKPKPEPKPEPRDEGPKLSLEEQTCRANDIMDIASDTGFNPKPFVSGFNEIEVKPKKQETSKQEEEPEENTVKWTENPLLLLHPRLYEDPQTKKDRWIRKLQALRRRKSNKSEAHEA